MSFKFREKKKQSFARHPNILQHISHHYLHYTLPCKSLHLLSYLHCAPYLTTTLCLHNFLLGRSLVLTPAMEALREPSGLLVLQR